MSIKKVRTKFVKHHFDGEYLLKRSDGLSNWQFVDLCGVVKYESGYGLRSLETSAHTGKIRITTKPFEFFGHDIGGYRFTSLESVKRFVEYIHGHGSITRQLLETGYKYSENKSYKAFLLSVYPEAKTMQWDGKLRAYVNDKHVIYWQGFSMLPSYVSKVRRPSLKGFLHTYVYHDGIGVWDYYVSDGPYYLIAEITADDFTILPLPHADTLDGKPDNDTYGFYLMWMNERSDFLFERHTSLASAIQSAEGMIKGYEPEFGQN